MPNLNPTITRALSYLLYERNLKRKTIIEWQLGVCPDWQVMAPELINSGKYKLAETCGLLRSGNGKTYDYFNHRITIPIHNLQGRVVGFGGRLIPKLSSQEGPKYLNSPGYDERNSTGNPIFHKSKILFGLHKAIPNFEKLGGACLVEGYFDVIKLHQRGWTNTIASCGTALTEEHAKLLKRYTDTVFIMRDGDNAGRKAIIKDIQVLVPQQFKIYVIALPDGEDPDTFFDRYNHDVFPVLEKYQDGIEWLADHYLAEGIASGEPSLIAEGIEKVVNLLADITNQVRRDQYVKTICKRNELKQITVLTKPLTALLQRRAQEAEEAAAADDDEEEKIPAWVDKKFFQEWGFAQLTQATKGFKLGVYFPAAYGVFPATNFVIKPLYHIYEQSNNRRLVEVFNGKRTAVVELPSQALVTKSVFESVLTDKGNYDCDYEFGAKQFAKLKAWLKNEMPIAYELKSLGWQPEGFFAFANAVYDPSTGELHEYDDNGMIKIGDTNYLSPGNSRIHRDERQTDNPYENDLYLKYVKPKKSLTFSEYAQLFSDVYKDHAPYGLAFAFITLFKDIATTIAKMPIQYYYGPKGSGKSAMGESITWLFFSGKNGEGKLINALNLNPGQCTPFSFFSRLERFRNCPVLLNEFDENMIEDWKFGTLKASYDGEGREVGDGTSFKNRKTKIQKVLGTIILLGQYPSMRDDGSVNSRSVSQYFDLNRINNLTQQEVDNLKYLQHLEDEGLSYLLLELLQHRPKVAESLKGFFNKTHSKLTEDTRKAGHKIEARLLNNYSLTLAAIQCMEHVGLHLPFTYASVYDQVFEQVINHNKLLKDNSAIHQFWKAVEVLFDRGVISDGLHLKVRTERSLRIKKGESTEEKTFAEPKQILTVRFSNLYSEYAKFSRERTGKAALPEDTILMYMKEQPYFIGTVPVAYWNDKRTSGYAFDYDMMESYGIVLQKNDSQSGEGTPQAPPPTPPPAPAPVQGEFDYPKEWDSK